MVSGLNLAVFSLSSLRLEVEAGDGNPAVEKVLDLRADPNRVVTTILRGNVGINVLLTLLSDSVLAGVSAFAFSTIVITLFWRDRPASLFFRQCDEDGFAACTGAAILSVGSISRRQTFGLAAR